MIVHREWNSSFFIFPRDEQSSMCASAWANRCLLFSNFILSFHFYIKWNQSFFAHTKITLVPVQKDEGNPCVPSPCGPNSQCRVIGNQGACSCLPNYVGRPPNCRPECTINAECASNKACRNERCVDPCIGYCGENALCSVVKHNPVCTCNTGYEGDPLTRCTITVVPRKI